MDRNLRVIAAVLAFLAGLLKIFTSINERPAGSAMPLGDIAMGLFWIAFAAWIYSSRPKTP